MPTLKGVVDGDFHWKLSSNSLSECEGDVSFDFMWVCTLKMKISVCIFFLVKDVCFSRVIFCIEYHNIR